jgi:hypothetical protein
MTQLALAFDARPASLPYSGRTALSRECSKAAAKQAAVTRATKTAAYLAWLAAHGPASDHDAQRRFGWPMSSITSIRNGINDRAIAEGQAAPIRARDKVPGPYGTPVTRWEVR